MGKVVLSSALGLVYIAQLLERTCDMILSGASARRTTMASHFQTFGTFFTQSRCLAGFIVNAMLLHELCGGTQIHPGTLYELLFDLDGGLHMVL